MDNTKHTKKKPSFSDKLSNSAFGQFFIKHWENFTKTAFGQKFCAHFQKQGYLYFSFFVPALLFFMVFILQGTYPFGNGSVLVLDLNGQYVYFFEALRKAIYGDASLLYSWFGTLGGEFIGIYAYYLASPLSYLVALFPAGAMTEALLVIELMKCGFCGLTMAYYLRKTRPLANEMITISIAIMYALCAFAIVMAHNTMWIDCLIWLPMVTYGIERIINYGHFKLFIVALTMSMVSNFYIGYMVCFYVFIYFFYYYFFASHRANTSAAWVIEGDNNFIGENHHFFKSLVRIGAASVIAIMISCFIILPTYYSLTLGKTTFSDPSWQYVLWGAEGSEQLFFKFTPFDFISKLFIASYDSVRRTGFPFLYCGMFTLILVPVYFISKRVNLRQKIGAALILFVFFLSMIIAPVDMIWHGAQEPNWLNYRYSFMFSFLLLVLAHRGLELLHTVKFKKTAIVAAVWSGLVFLSAIFVYPMFETPEVSFIRRLLLFLFLPVARLCIYEAAHFYLLKERKNPVARSAMITTLAVIVCLEMFVGTLLNTTSLNEDVTFSPKYTRADGTWLEGYDNFIDRFRTVSEAIQEYDTSFYRMEKDHLRKYGDNFALAMRGTTGSTSTLNERTITFLKRLGFISQSNISSHKGATSVADTLLGIKYLIGDNEHVYDSYYLEKLNILTNEYGEATNESEYADNKYLYAFLNKYALSIAYASNEDIKNFNITDTTSPFATMNRLITAILGSEDRVEVFKEIAYTFTYSDNTDYSNASYAEKLYDLEGNPVLRVDKDGNLQLNSNGEPLYDSKTTPYHTFTLKENAEGKIEVVFTFTAPETMAPSTEILFKLPTNYSRECTWTFKSNTSGASEKTGSCYDDDDKTACILSLGTMNPGDTGTLTVTVGGSQLYIDRSEGNGIFYYVDETLYQDTMTKLAEGNLVIEDYTESYFKGTINAKDGMTSVFTSIPYEPYWEVRVDGKKVDTYMSCAALVGFDIGSSGSHTVEIEYVSAPLNTGIAISVAGVVLFAAWAVADGVYFRKRRLTADTIDYECLSQGDYQNDGYDEEAELTLKKARKHEKRRGN
ncbi:MAG: YfhO family protein [Clostridia bacterium]|nr:YfhO family protein [Clostridia bacterium]